MKRFIVYMFAAICSTIAIAQNQPYDKIVDGICYKIIGDEAMVTAHDSNEEWNTRYYSGKIVIPATITYNNKVIPVTTIGRKAFFQCHNVTEVYLGDNITTIQSEAFSSIVGLEKMRIGANLKELGKNAFSYLTMSKLDLEPANKSFVLEKGVLYTADHEHAYTFVGDLYNYDMYNVSHSHDLWLHDDVVYIEDGFCGGRRLNTVRFGNKIKSIGESAFDNAFSETDNQPDLILPDGIEYIGRRAFADCIRVNNLHLPDSLTRLEPFSFTYVSPEFIHMPKNLKVICDNALACSGGGLYKNLVLPEGLDSIGEFGITGIGCDSLIVPSTVRHLSFYSLEGFSRYIEIKAPLDSIASCAMPSPSVRELVLPKTLKRIETGAFYPCYDLVKIVWPDSLEYIGVAALAGNKVNPMVMPSTVKTLGGRALSENVWQPRTYYFTSPTPPTCLGDGVFDGVDLGASTLYVPKGSKNAYACTTPWAWFGTIEEYTDIIIPPTPLRYDFEYNGIYYNIISEEDMTCEVSYDLNFITDRNTYRYKDVTIPETATCDGKSYTVIGIEGYAFYETPLKHITLPKSLTYMDCAFANSYDLESIDIPENVTSIGGAFTFCNKIKNIHLPEKITNIASAFHGCTSLESVNIPDAVTLVDGAFHGCKNLETIIFPDNITHIGEFTCFMCSKLKYVKLPANLEEIQENAFAECVSLKSITLPSKLHIIKSCAFGNCESLTDVTSLNTEPPYGIGYDWFTFLRNDATLHVPSGCKAAYEGLSIWKYFNIIEDADAASIRLTNIKSTVGKAYDILGRPVNDDYKGVVIKDGKLKLQGY